MDKMNIAIIQARLNSSRFPEKVIKKINENYIIEVIIKRLLKSKKLNKIIVAIPYGEKNKKLELLLKNLFPKINIIKGSEKNLVSRYVKASTNFNDETNLIRITADCPLVDIDLLDKMILIFEKNNYDYLSNTLTPTFPDGLDIEIFKKKTLIEFSNKKLSKFEKEHLTPYLKKNKKYKKYNLNNGIDLSHIRLTIDEYDDYFFIKKIFKYFDNNIYVKFKDITKLINKEPSFFNRKKIIKRNIGSSLSTGIKIWQRAKKVIPGGNMLFSKRPEMFLPNGWPSYFSKTSGCQVWDLDNKKYYDFCSMGVGTNILGYSNNVIDKQVAKVIKKGNVSTFNCYEEVLLAEKLLNINKWAGMVRFARTGAEANSMALRIARAYTGKEKVAVCGYHGWHDWYLSGNFNLKQNNNANNLKINGIPKKMKNLTFYFDYNNIESLKKILRKHKLAAIFMEVERNIKPDKKFLSEIKILSKKYNTLLIFDECTSGFRETFGGLHKKYQVYPDLCVFGKALGNGYAITSVIGRKKVMNSAQDTFISSTFNTERIGPTAALKTLELMEKLQSWKIISDKGNLIKSEWYRLSKKYDLNLNVTGLKSCLKFEIKSNNWLKYRTYITQEMLKKGFLSTNIIFTSTAHTERLINKYISNLDAIFQNLSNFENGVNIDEYLEYPVCHTDFKRLN